MNLWKIKLKNVLFILVISVFVFMIFIIFHYKDHLGNKRTIEEIRMGFEGVITNKFSTRDGISPTHLHVKIPTGTIEISPNEDIVDEAVVGDSLIKPKNENHVLLIKSNGKVKKYFYTKISLETRNSKNFPKEWKNKWMESSKFETEN